MIPGKRVVLGVPSLFTSNELGEDRRKSSTWKVLGAVRVLAEGIERVGVSPL